MTTEADPAWTLVIEGVSPELERIREALLTIADGVIGTRGSAFAAAIAGSPAVFAAGLYRGEGEQSELLSAPTWNQLPIALESDGAAGGLRRILDLRAAVLHEALDGLGASAILFSSLARPGTVGIKASLPTALANDVSQELALTGSIDEDGRVGDAVWARVRADPGAVAIAARQTVSDANDRRTIVRLGTYSASSEREPGRDEALGALDAAGALGFEGLLDEHQSAWAERWERADVRIEGDPELQLAVRLALFHLIGSVGCAGEAAVGARGLSGPAYRGHVFWDACVYVLPFLAATHPPAARAMLQYRLDRLDAAREAARAQGHQGARFPWESAATGADVTPHRGLTRAGEEVEIRTGELEEHIVADVAWAAACYLDWTGDEEFRRGPGARLLTETARYWASRIEIDRGGRGHIRNVIGPDEYHVGVDDNAYTNVMARWNLRYAADLVAGDASDKERRRWCEIANSLVDGYDPATGLYEQSAGFFDLEPVLIRDLAPSRPIAADLLLGRERTAGAQVLKQADVLMLHHLVPEQVPAGSLEPNLAFYEPRTAHASSLSPGVHASLFARAGQLDAALSSLRLAARIDLDDLSGTTAGGLHLAAMGSVWQALAFGFLGLRPRDGVLHIDPHLPGEWEQLEMRLIFRGAATRLRVGSDGVHAASDLPISVALAGAEPMRTAAGGRFLQVGSGVST